MGLRERLRDLAKTAEEHEADEIRTQAGRCSPKETVLIERRPSVITGTIRSVTIPPERSVPLLVADVFDGRSSVNLIWVGRRRIAGIEPGAFLTARGRATRVRGHLAMFNPDYDLVAT